MREAERIKNLRKRTGLAQRTFAERFEIPLRTLQGWELGERTPAEYIVNMIEKIIDLEERLEKETSTSWERAHENEIAIQKINDNPNDFQLLVNGEPAGCGALEDHIETISEIKKWEDFEELLEPCR